MSKSTSYGKDTKTTVNLIDLELVGIDEVIKNIANTTAKDIRAKAPKKSGEYAKGIKATKVKINEYAVSNKGKRYTLGHLLEFGSVHTRAQSHYRVVYPAKKKEFIDEMKKIKIKNKNK